MIYLDYLNIRLKMKYSTILSKVLILSFVLSLLGFIIDLGERTPNIWINLRDIFAMTIIFFVIITSVYLTSILLYKGIKKNYKPRVGKNKT
jgi:hypothetical protein